MMKKWMLKRTGTWLVLVIFVFTTVLSMAGMGLEAHGVEASDFVLTHGYTSTLRPGMGTFLLPLKMRNLTAATTISNIELDFSNAGIVALTDGGTIYIADSAISVSPGTGDINISGAGINLRYIGDGTTNTMTIGVKYSLNSGGVYKEVSASLIFTVEKPSANEPTTPVDTSKYKPNIVASIASNIELSAGKTSTVDINLKNLSTLTSARNILITPIYKEDSPFISVKVLSEAPIKQLASDASADIKLSIEVNKFASEGVLPFTFKLSYMNAWSDEITSEHTVYIKVTNYQSNCNLNLQFPAGKTVAASAGGTFDLPLVIKNSGSLSAKEVKVSLTGLSQESFMLSSGTGRYDFYRIFGNETYNMTYTLKVSSALKSGSHPVTFVIEYLDEKGTAGKVEQQVWIPVAGSEDKVSMLEILEITPSRTTVKPGESFDVTVKVKNSGDFEARQIKVSADGTTSLLPVSQNLFIIPSLKKDETKSIVFKFQPQHDAARGGVPITLKVESVEGGSNTTIAQAISVFIDSASDGKPADGKNIPKIIVKSYSSEPTLVKAGENFTLNMQFLNTHASKSVGNIKGNFVVSESSNETGNVFSPVDSSNTFYIDKISPKGTSDWQLTLYTIPDAKSKTYTVTVSFEYEDDTGTQYKADELIGIPVYQPSRFEISELSLPPETFMGQPLFLGFEMYNMGKTDIYNVKLNVEGDFEAQPKSNYFGNFESGRTEYFEINLIPMMIGKANGRIVFQYENSSGEKKELVKEISMNVMEMMMPPDGGMPVDGKPMDPGMEGNGNKGFIGSVWFFVILGILVVGAIITTIFVVRKRKKNKEFDF